MQMQAEGQHHTPLLSTSLSLASDLTSVSFSSHSHKVVKIEQLHRVLKGIKWAN